MSVHQPPSLGRIVHFVDEVTHTSHAAIIVATVRERPALSVRGPDAVNLRPYPHHGDDLVRIVEGVLPGTDPGCWHWPPRVEPVTPVPSAAPPPQVLTGVRDAATSAGPA